MDTYLCPAQRHQLSDADICVPHGFAYADVCAPDSHLDDGTADFNIDVDGVPANADAYAHGDFDVCTTDCDSDTCAAYGDSHADATDGDDCASYPDSDTVAHTAADTH
jgi:hypothetical protein